MPVSLSRKFFKLTIAVVILGCLGFSASHDQSTYAQLGDEFHSTSRTCGYPGLRFDMNKIIAAAKGYPNSEILILTPQEKRQIQLEIQKWNEQGKQPRKGMAPCFNCSREYEACIVYTILEDEFHSDPVPPTPAPTPTVPAMHCRDQVEVLRFVARPLSGFVPHIGMPLPPDPRAGRWIMSLYAGRRFAGERIQGITFEARVWIKGGPIPVDNIHIRYIQNVNEWDGSIFYSRPPHPHTTLRPECGSLPILDLGTREVPRTPFYTVGFRETPESGPSRTVTMSDAPRPDNIVIRRPDGSQTREINVGSSYTTFLGCVIGDDEDGATFETLSTIDWQVRYTGRVISTGGLPPY